MASVSSYASPASSYAGPVVRTVPQRQTQVSFGSISPEPVRLGQDESVPDYSAARSPDRGYHSGDELLVPENFGESVAAQAAESTDIADAAVCFPSLFSFHAFAWQGIAKALFWLLLFYFGGGVVFSYF